MPDRFILFTLLLATSSAFAAGLLTPQPPIKIPAKAGARFDFLEIDAVRNRLLAAHTGNASLDVIDLNSGKLLKSVPTGNAQDSAIAGNQYLASVSKPPQVAIIDAGSLQLTGTIPLDHSVWIAYANPSGAWVQQFVKP